MNEKLYNPSSYKKIFEYFLEIYPEYAKAKLTYDKACFTKECRGIVITLPKPMIHRLVFTFNKVGDTWVAMYARLLPDKMDVETDLRID